MQKIILLRGMGREAKHWDEDFLDQLESRGLTPTPMDLPGAGNYRHLMSPTRIEDYVQFLQTRLKETTKPGEKVFLLGHSLGGMVALRWAYEYPGQFEKVFLVNTSDNRSRALPDRLRLFGLKKIFSILRQKEIQKREKEILDMVANSKVAKAEVYKKWLELACSRPVKTISLVNQFVAASRFSSPSCIEVPMVFITSTKDLMVSYKCSEKLASQHKSEIFRHHSAGHDIAIDAPEWLVESVVNASGVKL